MTIACKTFALTPTGAVVAVLANGTIAEQRPRPGNRSGHYDADWHPLTAGGIASRVVQLATRYNGALVALTAAGELFALERRAHGWAKEWQRIEPPAELEH